VEAEGKELGSETAPLSSPCTGLDHLRGEAVTPNIQLRRYAIHSPDPIPEAREAAGHYIKEGTAVHGIESIGDIKSYVNPARVLI
tara:strand:- start:378 stop:632 length:255 start_codon:yes stop_codon:yes gene_type:complete